MKKAPSDNEVKKVMKANETIQKLGFHPLTPEGRRIEYNQGNMKNGTLLSDKEVIKGNETIPKLGIQLPILEGIFGQTTVYFRSESGLNTGVKAWQISNSLPTISQKLRDKPAAANQKEVISWFHLRLLKKLTEIIKKLYAYKIQI
mgnify:CR=1 FL=1